MDPPLVNESSFSAANPSAYSLLEIWPPPPPSQQQRQQQQLPLVNHDSRPGNAGSGTRIGNSGDGSVEGSTVTEQNGSGGRKRKEINGSEEDIVSTSCASDLNNAHKRMAGSRNQDGGSKSEVEASSALGKKAAEKSSKPSDPPKDYIHVRARRGQATDSHSLAERARREKISERMKILQDLVPGCNKIIGKALVLDEIINYIQSLQCQVEFLSMKLEAVNSRVNLHAHPNIEGFPTKDPFDSTGITFPSQETRVYAHGSQSDWLHMQIGGKF